MTKYDHIPRPEIENHYHIRELIERQEARVADRNAHRDREKQANERQEEIQKAPMAELKDFWCGTCKEDFRGVGVKHVDSWSPLAYYKTKCKICKNWSMRLITDKHRDKYFYRSKLVAYDRGKNALDMIQPGQTGFNLLYGKK